MTRADILTPKMPHYGLCTLWITHSDGPPHVGYKSTAPSALSDRLTADR